MPDTSVTKKQVFEDIFDVLAGTQFVSHSDFIKRYEFEIDNDKGEIALRNADTQDIAITLTYH